MPAISAVIPTYNRAHFIGEAIESVLAQSRAVDEIIVVDDGSTDHTPEVLAGFGNRIRYIRQENAGPSAARNRGIQAAGGDYIAFQDSDDLWLPDKIAVQIGFLAANPDVDIVFGLMANFRSLDDPLEAEIKNQAIRRQLEESNGRIADMFSLLLIENIVPTPTVLLRRGCIDKVGAFDTRLKIAEDFDLWLRAAAVCKFGFVDQILLRRRRHEANLIDDRITRLSCRLSILERLEDRFPELVGKHGELLNRQISALNYDLGSLYFKNGKYRAALSRLRRCDQPESGRFPCIAKKAAAMTLIPFERKAAGTCVPV